MKRIIKGVRKELPNRRELSHRNAASIISDYEKANAKMSNDTINRTDIHNLILKLVNQGEGKISILNKLQNQFPESKYSIYFGNWVDDQIEKHKVKNSIDKDSYEER